MKARNEENLFIAKSGFWPLLFNGKILHILFPWVIEVNLNESYITVKKRNWYLIGIDSQYIAFRFIRNITIDEHLFGADLFIKAIGGNVNAYCLKKKDVRKIRNMLNEYNRSRGKTLIFA